MDDRNPQPFGLTERDIATIRGILSAYREVDEVWIFGSRAKGSQRPGSDIDLAILTEGISNDILRKIIVDLEESSLPYFVDVVYFPTLKNKELAAEITAHGKPIYSQSAGIAHTSKPVAG
jgi:uncharacterized protein